MNIIKYLFIVLIIAVTAATGLFFRKQEKPRQGNVPIRILDSSAVVNDWEIIKKLTGRDILEEEGVTLELIANVQSTGGTQSLQALLAENIDFAGSGWTAWINVLAMGGKVKAVVGNWVMSKDDPGFTWVVLDESNIHEAGDFVGKKLGLNVLGVTVDHFTRQYLKQNGLSIDQVQLVVVPGELLEQTLRTRQVDIAALSASGLYLALERGGLRILFTQYDIGGDLLGYGEGFREDFIREHPETVRRFVTAYEKSRRLVWDELRRDPEWVKKAVAAIYEEKGGNPKLAKYYKPAFSPQHPFPTDKDIQWWLDAWIKDGKLKPGQIKPSDIYTNEFNPYYTKKEQ